MVKTFSKSVHKFKIGGLKPWWPALIRANLAASMPSLFGILVYKLETSIVTRKLPGGIFSKLSNLVRKCVVSCTYKGSSLTVGWRKKIGRFFQ